MIKGINPTLLNVTYIRPNKNNGYTDKFEVVYKTEDGEVRKSDEPAEADIYIVKPEFRNYNYNKPQERMERMDKVRVPIKDIRNVIEKESGDYGKQIRARAEGMNDFKILNQLYRWPYAFACDFQPEYYFMKNWYEKYQLKRPKLTVAYLDIETDLMDYQTNLDDIPNTAYSPVNLITVILEDTKEAWTFILKPYKPPRQGRSDEEYRKRYTLYEKQLKAHQELVNNKQKFIERIHNEFDNTYGHIHYNIREYEREIDLIADAFRLINTRKPNFCLTWNMRFDVQYLYHRIIALGYDPASIMCHPDFKDNPRCAFKVDRSTFQLEKQYDYFFVSSYTMYICQMRLYASIRKSQHKLKSVKLNAIADRELKDKKVEYPEAANIVTFPYLDWLLFIIYNIKDVLLQLGIERKTKDVMTYYMRSHQNMTPYNKIFKETHLLRNVRETYFNKEGWVQGNNINIIDDNITEDEKIFYGLEDDDDDEKTSYKGAINAEPTWNANVGMYLNGIRSNNLFMNPMDFDMGAFYPSIKIASNMDPGTLLYKAAFNNNEFISGEMPNRSLNTTYVEKDKNGNMRNLDITGEAINTFVSGNILTMGYNYFGLPSMTELMNIVERELQ